MGSTVNLAVAIATMDRPDALTRCLDAVFTGTMLPREVIVVDQSSGDATQRMVEQRRTEHQEPLIYIRQPRRGLSASRNAGIACATCPIIAVTDDDCLPGPGWVEAIELAFASSDAVHAVTGRMLPLGPDAPGLHAASSRSSIQRRDFFGKSNPLFIGTGGNTAVKREWYLRAGGYDERLGAGSPGKAAEDIDFFYRLLCSGACIRYEPDALVYHERHTQARYIASRWSYGFGIGAFCGAWLGRRDFFPLRILGFWLRFQGRELLTRLLHGDWNQASQTARLLLGTASGLAYGLWRLPVNQEKEKRKIQNSKGNNPCEIQ